MIAVAQAILGLDDELLCLTPGDPLLAAKREVVKAFQRLVMLRRHREERAAGAPDAYRVGMLAWHDAAHHVVVSDDFPGGAGEGDQTLVLARRIDAADQ